MPSSSSARSLSPSILGAISRFRRIVITSVVVLALIFAFYAIVASPSYAGKASIVITPPPAQLHPFFGSGQSGAESQFVDRQIALLQSQSVADNAAAIVNAKISDADITGKQLLKNLTVKAQTGVSLGLSPTTTVTVNSGRAEVAAAEANAMIEAYISATHAQIKQQANQSVSALNSQIQTLESQLNSLPASTGTSRSTTPTTARPPRTTTTQPPRTTTTRPPRTTTTRAPRTTTTRAPRTTTTTGGTTTSANGPASNGRTQVAFTPQGGELDMQLAASATTTTSTTTSTTVAGISTAGATTTTQPASSTTSSAATTGQRAALLNQLLELDKSKSQVMVDEQADLQYSMVVYPATIPTSPTNGSFWKYLGIGLLLGLLIGIILAYVLAYTNQVIEREEDPEILYEVPLLAAVPAFRHATWLPAGLPMLSEPFEESAEAFRTIATTLRSLRNSHMTMLVAVSAAAPRSGTTTAVANTGLALADMGERVLVIDGDPVGRGLTRMLAETNPEKSLNATRPGFSETVAGRPLMQSVVRSAANENLYILTSGLDPDLAVSRWSGQAIRLFFEDCKANFDLILIDVPPLGSSYGVDLARAAGTLLLIVPYLDPVKHHRQLPERLELANVGTLGYVFNGAPSKGDFLSYYPLLRSTDALPDGGAQTLPPPVPALVSSGPMATTMETTAQQPLPPDDITTMVPAVDVAIEPDPTGEVEAVAHTDDITRQIPVLESESSHEE